MSYDLKTTLTPGYLHVSVRGENTPENIKRYLADVRQKCSDLLCFDVLIEENLEGPGLNITSIYDLVDNASATERPPQLRIAYIDVNPKHDHAMMKFAEDVAVNRGINVRVFAEVSEAEKWLKGAR